MRRLQDRSSVERAQTIAHELPAARLPERLAWPAAALAILGCSLVLWLGIGAAVVALIG